MNFFKVLLIIMSLALVQCAKTAPDLRPSDELTIYVYAEKTGLDSAYCYVDLRDPANNHDYHRLGPEDLITCDGQKTTPVGGGWSANFYHPGTDPVRVSIIRPKAGSTLIRYSSELQ